MVVGAEVAGAGGLLHLLHEPRVVLRLEGMREIATGQPRRALCVCVCVGVCVCVCVWGCVCVFGMFDLCL